MDDEPNAQAELSETKAGPDDIKYVVTRGNTIAEVSADEFGEGTYWTDGNVYEMCGAEGDLILAKPFIDNAYFESPAFSGKDPLISIQEFLTYWGKIPAFLELVRVPGKGYGIRTKVNLKQGTFLGHYEGVVRPSSELDNESDLYVFQCSDDDYAIDAENLVYANWIRFVNDGENPNCEATGNKDNSVLLFASQDIKAGDELIYNYGPDYWKTREKLP